MPIDFCLHITPSILGHSKSWQAQWVKLQRILGEDVAISNIYGLHTIRVRGMLCELINTLPRNSWWIHIGDKNIIRRNVISPIYMACPSQVINNNCLRPL